MLRLLLAGFLSLLLVGLQHDAFVHALQHDVARISDNRDSGLRTSGGEGPCAWCPLFSAGTEAPPLAAAAAFDKPAAEAAHWASHAVRLAAPVAYYSSRAPPVSRC